MTGFYHGNEVVNKKSDLMTVAGADISIVGIIGTAPVFMLSEENRKINEAVCINNSTEAAQCVGQNLSGYTLPDAVETVLAESDGAKMYVVNVFDPAKHKADLTTTKAFENNKIELNEKGIFNLVVSKDDTTFVLDMDYTFADNIITIKEGGSLSDKDEVSISYSYADVSKVTAQDIIGTVDEFGTKTGMKVLEDVESLYGDQIGILICPTYDGLEPVSNALEALEAELDAYSYVNAPYGTTKNQAIQGRGAKGDINFNTVDESRMLIAPYVKRYNSYEDKYEIKPSSPVFAGLRVKVDREEGIQTSISNQPTKTVSGLEYPVTFRIGKSNTDANDLNAKGISTIINFNGFRTFGTRSANFPSKSGIETFECCKRVDIFIRKSILAASFATVDKNITSGMINGVVDGINAFLDDLKNPLKQVIIDGSCWYDPTVNAAAQLADGWVRFCYKYVAPPPAERITFYRYIDIQLLSNIGA